jgi:hypothetical protein
MLNGCETALPFDEGNLEQAGIPGEIRAPRPLASVCQTPMWRRQAVSQLIQIETTGRFVVFPQGKPHLAIFMSPP